MSHPNRETERAAKAAFNTLWDINQVMKVTGTYSVVNNLAKVYVPREAGLIPILALYNVESLKRGSPEDLQLCTTLNGPKFFMALKDVKVAVSGFSWGPDGVSVELDEEAVNKKRPNQEDVKKWLAWREPPSMRIEFPLDRMAAIRAAEEFDRLSSVSAPGIVSVDATGLVPDLMEADSPVLVVSIAEKSAELREGFGEKGSGLFQIRIDKSMFLKLSGKSQLLVTIYPTGEGASLVAFEVQEQGCYIEQYLKIVSI